MRSPRLYAGREIWRRAGAAGAPTVGGGTALLNTSQHALDGPEHTAPTQGGDLEGAGADLRVRALLGVELDVTPPAADHPQVLTSSDGTHASWQNASAGGSPSVWLGPWDAGTTYTEGDAVSHDGSAWLASGTSTGEEPPGADWDLLAQAGAPGTPGTNGTNGTDGGGGGGGPDVPHGFVLTKQGVVIARGGTGSWCEALVESPAVFWDPAAGVYRMVYVGYSGDPGSIYAASIGHATANTPDGPWTLEGVLLGPSGTVGAPDRYGASGPFVFYEAGTYYLFYIGLTLTGYEQGEKTLCLATSDDFATWMRHGTIIAPTSGWRGSAIWHPCVVKRAATYYLFFNATGSTETIGYATSDDLASWTVDDAHSPVLSPGSGWESVHIGDPAVYRIGDTWYMAYYGYNGSHAYDGIAFTADADFPLGGTRSSANPVLSPGGSGSIDEKYAHKPAILVTAGRLYHWYTAVSTGSPEVRQIALATEGPAAGSGGATPTLDAVLAASSGEDIAAALTGANAPSGGYPFLTMADLAVLMAWLEGLTSGSRWEVLMADGLSQPPEPVSDESGADWLYGEVS